MEIPIEAEEIKLEFGDKEELYDYTPEQKKLLEKVLKFMRPLHHNKIRQKLQSDPIELRERITFKAISRLAFEQDPELMIKATMLDYNNLQ